jgi:hypothetical protein
VRRAAEITRRWLNAGWYRALAGASTMLQSRDQRVCRLYLSLTRAADRVVGTFGDPDDSRTKQPREGRVPMASLKDRIMGLARSPKGRELADQAKEQLQKPENRKRLDQLKERIQGSGKRRDPEH